MMTLEAYQTLSDKLGSGQCWKTLRVQVPEGDMAAKILQEEERTEILLFIKKENRKKNPKPAKKEFCYKTTAII